LKNRLLARSVPLYSHTSTIATRPHLQVGRSHHGGTIRRFNLQSVESWLTLWELELSDGALEDIVYGEEESENGIKCLWNDIKTWGYL
jgi:hypothetical protein